MPGCRTRPEFLIDRSLGRSVAESLRQAGMTVRTLADVFPDREQHVTDAEWLALAGANDWSILSKDKRIRFRQSEIQAIQAHSVRAFVLATGNLTGNKQIECFLKHRERIEALAELDGPFVFALDQRSVRQLWPKATE